MISVLLSIVFSVSVLTIVFSFLKDRIVKKYGFNLIYILSFILAIRLVVPYTFQLPNVNGISLKIPEEVIRIYVSGVIISLLYHTIGYFHFSRNLKRYSCEIKDKELLSIYQKIKDDMFIEKDIPLYLSHKSDSPMLKGIIKPAIFLTKQEYSLEEYEMIFRHELTHYQNKDNFKKLFFMFVSALQWFNPFVYVLAANLNESLECLCDQKVVKNKDTDFKRDYSLTLLKTVSTHRSLLVSTLSTKEKMKMRINNIFDNTKKKSSVIPAIAVTLSAVMLSSFLCSCTVETPDDVIDEMNRIESGIDNEQSAESSNSDELLEIKVKPVSEVTAGAKAELDAIASTDGIFKFDNTYVYIPEKDELKIYKEERKYGLDTPQDIYDQLQYLEKEWLGCDIPDEEYTAVFFGKTERADVTIEEFLQSDDIAAIYNSAEEKTCGSIEHFYTSLRLWYTPLMKGIMEENPDLRISTPKETINCQNISKEDLSRKFVFSDGEITLSEVIAKAEDYMNNFKYTADKKITYKVESIDVYELKGGSEMLHINLRVMCENSPFVYVSLNSESDSPFTVTEIDGFDNMEMDMAHSGGYDYLMTMLSNTKFTEKESVKEIISLSDAFAIVKDTFSNEVVYDVKEVSLGQVRVSYDTCDFYDKSWETLPIWNIVLKNTSGTYIATIDAVTGEIYVNQDYR